METHISATSFDLLGLTSAVGMLESLTTGVFWLGLPGSWAKAAWIMSAYTPTPPHPHLAHHNKSHMPVPILPLPLFHNSSNDKAGLGLGLGFGFGLGWLAHKITTGGLENNYTRTTHICFAQLRKKSSYGGFDLWVGLANYSTCWSFWHLVAMPCRLEDGGSKEGVAR